MNRCRTVVPAVAVAAALAVVALGFVPQTQTAPPAGGSRGDMFPGLIQAIKSTPGCLGLETARTASGKNVIFAWFKDKQSVRKWYYSDTHMGVMEQFFGKSGDHHPLDDVPDDVGPLMVIASITPATQPELEQSSLPISQIAIEIYSPVNGGIFLSSRFSPDALQVPKMKDYTPKQ